MPATRAISPAWLTLSMVSIWGMMIGAGVSSGERNP